MKTLLTCFLLVLVSVTFSLATIHNLCNMAYSPGMFTTYAAAEAAANNGDTIYVHGSTITYGTIFINVPLVIIGTGHNPNKQNPLVSSFLDVIVQTSGVQLIGLRIRHLGSSSGTANCAVKKCRIIGDGSNWPILLYNSPNWLVEGNIIESPHTYECLTFFITASPGTIIQNNVFNGPTIKIYTLANNSSDRTYILNNVFLGQTSGDQTFFDLDYANIDNNIFYHSIPDGNVSQLGFCTMNNNISGFSNDNFIYQPGANNIVGDPLFVNYPGPQILFDYTWDISLQAASPGHNTGTDGTDRGVYGGIGFKFTATGEPSIAEITAFTITGPTTIPPGGNLSISVTSKRIH